MTSRGTLKLTTPKAAATKWTKRRTSWTKRRRQQTRATGPLGAARMPTNRRAEQRRGRTPPARRAESRERWWHRGEDLLVVETKQENIPGGAFRNKCCQAQNICCLNRYIKYLHS